MTSQWSNVKRGRVITVSGRTVGYLVNQQGIISIASRGDEPSRFSLVGGQMLSRARQHPPASRARQGWLRQLVVNIEDLLSQIERAADKTIEVIYNYLLAQAKLIELHHTRRQQAQKITIDDQQEVFQCIEALANHLPQDLAREIIGQTDWLSNQLILPPRDFSQFKAK